MKKNNELKETLRKVDGIFCDHCVEIDDICFSWKLVRNLVRAYRDFDRSETSESEALARWNINDANDDLRSYFNKWELSPDERMTVRDLIALCR